MPRVMRKRLRVNFHNFDHNFAHVARERSPFLNVKPPQRTARDACGTRMVGADVRVARWRRRKKMRFLLTSAFAVTLAYLELERPSSNDPPGRSPSGSSSRCASFKGTTSRKARNTLPHGSRRCLRGTACGRCGLMTRLCCGRGGARCGLITSITKPLLGSHPDR